MFECLLQSLSMNLRMMISIPSIEGPARGDEIMDLALCLVYQAVSRTRTIPPSLSIKLSYLVSMAVLWPPKYRYYKLSTELIAELGWDNGILKRGPVHLNAFQGICQFESMVCASVVCSLVVPQTNCIT